MGKREGVVRIEPATERLNPLAQGVHASLRSHPWTNPILSIFWFIHYNSQENMSSFSTKSVDFSMYQ